MKGAATDGCQENLRAEADIQALTCDDWPKVFADRMTTGSDKEPVGMDQIPVSPAPSVHWILPLFASFLFEVFPCLVAPSESAMQSNEAS